MLISDSAFGKNDPLSIEQISAPSKFLQPAIGSRSQQDLRALSTPPSCAETAHDRLGQGEPDHYMSFNRSLHAVPRPFFFAIESHVSTKATLPISETFSLHLITAVVPVVFLLGLNL